MKVIDLLVRIANGEKINKFKYYGGTYIYDKETQKYFYEDMWFDLDFSNLNDEVEVIEEDKKIEKLYIRDRANDILIGKSEKICYATESLVNKEIALKINEIIDRINNAN